MSFDFADVLDETKDVTVKLKGRPVVCSVYVLGYERIPYDDQMRLAKLHDEAMPVQAELAPLETELEGLNGDKPERRAEVEELVAPLRRQNRQHTIAISRQLVPLAVKEWKHEGEPLQYRGDCPPSECYRLPDGFVIEVAAKAGEVWGENQKKDLKPSGSLVEESAADLQTEATTHSSGLVE